MENASKALIIAGAILISILLISVGLLIFKSSKGTTDQALTTGNALETAAQSATDKAFGSISLTPEQQAFYNNYKDYEGENISYPIICNLVNDVISNNKDNSKHKITIKYEDISYEIPEATGGIVNPQNLTYLKGAILRFPSRAFNVAIIESFLILIEDYTN